MRLLVVTQYFWPETFKINDLVAGMVERGHEVTVLTGKPNYPDGFVFPDYAKDPKAYSRFAGAEIIRLPMPVRGKGSVRLALNYLGFAMSGLAFAPLFLRGRKFDAILICSLSPVTAALPAVLMRWLRRIPSVMWVLDLWPQSLEAVNAVRSKTALGAIDRLVGFIYRHSDLILGQSHSFVPEIGKHVEPSRIGYFPGWSETLNNPNDGSLAPSVVQRTDLFNVVFAGNMGEAQDFPAVLNAAELLRDEPVRWILVGDGRKAEWVRSEVLRRGLAEKVIMPGRFPSREMVSFYNHADALLVSLRPEPIFAMTIPGKVQEYLAAGLPILAMLDGEGADVVRKAEAGQTAPAGDFAALAAAVRQLMHMAPEDRKAMGAKGRAYCAREFGREHLFSRMEKHLLDLISRNEHQNSR